METQLYRIVDGAENMSVSEVMRLLKQTYWANTRTREQVTAASGDFSGSLDVSAGLAAFDNARNSSPVICQRGFLSNS